MPFKANLEGATEEEIQHVIESVRLVKNFPKPGLDFKDLSILLGQPSAYQVVVNSLVHRYQSRGITGSIEAR
jgi:adenine phosphoribosyltransferase